MNGDLIKTTDCHEHLNDLAIDKTGKYLLTGGMKKTLVVRELHTFKRVNKIKLPAPLLCCVCSPSGQIILGIEDGSVWLGQQNEEP